MDDIDSSAILMGFVFRSVLLKTSIMLILSPF
jgi:hypothetical protein